MATALIGALPGFILAALVFTNRSDLVDHRIKARAVAAAATEKPASMAKILLQAPILLCLGYFALLATNTVGIQQFAVPAWTGMFGVTENFAAICLMVFVVGSASGMLAGGYLADRFHQHERVAAIGLLTAAAFTVPVATMAVSPLLLPAVLFVAGFAGGTTGPSRDMIVRGITPPGASGKVFGFVYSGLDVGSFIAPLVFSRIMAAGHPAMMFWIATGLYVVNAGLVTLIRQATPRERVPAAAE